MKTKLISLIFGILMSPVVSMQAELIYSTTINLEYDGDSRETFFLGTPDNHFYDYLVYGLNRSELPQLIPGHTYTLRILANCDCSHSCECNSGCECSKNNYCGELVLTFEGSGTYFAGEEVYDEMNDYYYYTNTGNIQFADNLAIYNIIADRPMGDGQDYMDEELLLNIITSSCYYTSDWDNVPADSFIIELYD